MPTAVFDSATCPLAELTQHIRDTHHAYLRRELPQIWELLREAAAAPGACVGAARSVGRVFSRFRSTLDSHLRKEEDVLFPFVEQLERSLAAGEPAPAHAFGPLWLPIEILEGEHLFGDRLLDEMRPLWTRWRAEDDAPPIHQALCARMLALEADMRCHTHLEDEVLFPRTITLEGRSR
jgi:regulator of cell morphogenesis and NO signaling